MGRVINKTGVLLLAVFLLAATAIAKPAPEDQCPQPRVKVSNDLDYYAPQRASGAEHNYLAMNTAVGNSTISLNSGEIRFFSAFTAAVPVGEVDYHLSVGSRPNGQGVMVSIKLVDNNNRVVLNRTEAVAVSDWPENINTHAQQIAKELSPLINDIRKHQIHIRSTSMAAISSKFEPEKPSYTVQPEDSQKIRFVLKDCDDAVLPNRTVNLELDGPGRINQTSVTVDAEGRGEFVYMAPRDVGTAKVILAHQYEDVAGNDNRFSVDAVDIIISGKLWLLVDHKSKSAEIIVIGEHNGPLEMGWDSENTRGGIFSAFSSDEDEELWSSSFIGFIEMKVDHVSGGVWKVSHDWFSGEAKITKRKEGGFEIEILWPLEGGGIMPVHGIITQKKPQGFDDARRRYLAVKRSR